MKSIRFAVEPSEAGTRLDQLIAQRAPELSRARAKQLIDEGQVRVDEKLAKASLRPREGQSIAIDIPAPKPIRLEPKDLSLRPLYEDEELLVLDKPAGIAVHPGAGGEGETLVHGLLHHVGDLRGIGGELRPGIVHRLDKDTSGCLVVAKSEASLQRLQSAFKARQVEKRYLALVHGLVAERGELDTLYGRHPVDRKRFSSQVREGKRAQTRWTRLAAHEGGARAGKPQAGRSGAGEQSGSASFVEVELLTGRTHQIRAHFADAGHPLLGDSLYGGVKREGRLDERDPIARAAKAVGRQALHAWKLAFAHPSSGKPIACTAPIPSELRAALGALGIDPDALGGPPLPAPPSAARAAKPAGAVLARGVAKRAGK